MTQRWDERYDPASRMTRSGRGDSHKASCLGVIVTVGLCVISPALAQDGTLVEASTVTLSEETLTRLETVEPTIRTILAQVDIRSMTYLSDG